MDIPFLDLSAPHRALAAEFHAAFDRVLAASDFTLGNAVQQFEEHFARYVGAEHCVGVSNGTVSLQLALLACGVGPGDEVITTPHTWISTSWAISYVGATPVYVDIDPVTYNLDPTLVEAAITPRTRAIMPVHLYGHAADLDPLVGLAERYGLELIEDTAQAHGARYRGRCAGTIGRVGSFSFYPGKNLGALGEAGAIVTNDSRVAERIRCLRDHAQARRHHHVEIGFNARLGGLQAAMLDIKLRHLRDWTACRVRSAERYRELLGDVPGLVLPTATEPDSHVWHLYVVQVPGADRDQFRARLAARGVSTGVHYPKLVPYQPVYAGLGYKRGAFPVAEQVSENCVSLPMYPHLTDDQVVRVAAAVRECLADQSASQTAPRRAA